MCNKIFILSVRCNHFQKFPLPHALLRYGFIAYFSLPTQCFCALGFELYETVPSCRGLSDFCSVHTFFLRTCSSSLALPRHILHCVSSSLSLLLLVAVRLLIFCWQCYYKLSETLRLVSLASRKWRCWVRRDSNLRLGWIFPNTTRRFPRGLY